MFVQKLIFNVWSKLYALRKDPSVVYSAMLDASQPVTKLHEGVTMILVKV